MMTQFSEDDKPLVHFLKQHQSHPPEAHPDLEEQIMALVQQPSVAPQQSVRPQFKPFQRRLYLRPLWLSTAIAAGMTFAIIGYRTLPTTQLTLAEERELEAFVAESWNETMGADAEADLFMLQATANQ
ncbi:MAG: hypothetical protein WBA13_05885 [Microcoleaceae cyanobacterium]